MKKSLILLILSFFSIKGIYARHILGGEMFYDYVGPGSAPGTIEYLVTLKLYRDPAGAALDPAVTFSIFNSSTNALVITLPGISLDGPYPIFYQTTNPCITPPQTLIYDIGYYRTSVELPISTGGYTIAYQRCCRRANIQNLTASDSQGATYFTTIPGTGALASAPQNSSPKFVNRDSVVICKNSFFSFDFSAVDPDGDSLYYYFSQGFNGGGQSQNNGCTGVIPNPPCAPPYQVITYNSPYTAASPMGSQVIINSRTGIISGISPGLGDYVVTVYCNEYRNGVLINTHYKEFLITVKDCTLPHAQPPVDYVTCDGLTITFSNNSTGNITDYFWDFGVPGTLADTSHLETPTYAYIDTGIYRVMLIVNRNGICTDTGYSRIGIYPGFFPGLRVNGQCKNTPIQFTDLTTTRYGSVGPWHWNFGDLTAAVDTSVLMNPTHTYAATGTYPVQFIVSNSKGCTKKIDTTIAILDRPALAVSPDTLICSIDTIQIVALGTGTFLWSPNYNISNVNISNPLISPDVPTTYHVTLTDPYGCVGTDAVKVDVKTFVTLRAQSDTTICKTDPVVLQITSDGLHFLWTEIPFGNSLNDPTLKNPIAKPLVTTIYRVVANIGKCQSQADIKITPIPYPAANAGPDTAICLGRSARLNASGGSIYSWSPPVFLSNPNIPNPICLNPTASVNYSVTVRDILGCPKAVRDTMRVNVIIIKANAGPRDTVVVIDQPLQLHATGGIGYLWIPSTWLDNPNIDDPVALPRENIEYVVRVNDNIGCYAFDSIRVKVYKLAADILVPNAFSPNGDGINDIFRPTPVGMRSLDVFRVYNRWGQLLYSNADANAGWDGKYAGVTQEAATYVWYAEGVDYKYSRIKRKGYVLLIR